MSIRGDNIPSGTERQVAPTQCQPSEAVAGAMLLLTPPVDFDAEFYTLIGEAADRCHDRPRTRDVLTRYAARVRGHIEVAA